MASLHLHINTNINVYSFSSETFCTTYHWSRAAILVASIDIVDLQSRAKRMAAGHYAAANKYEGYISSLGTHILRFTFMVIDAYCDFEAAKEAHVSDFEEVLDFTEEELWCSSNIIRTARLTITLTLISQPITDHHKSPRQPRSLATLTAHCDDENSLALIVRTMLQS